MVPIGSLGGDPIAAAARQGAFQVSILSGSGVVMPVLPALLTDREQGHMTVLSPHPVVLPTRPISLGGSGIPASAGPRNPEKCSLKIKIIK